MKTPSNVAAMADLTALFFSLVHIAAADTQCNVEFNRLSKQNAASWLASIEHRIDLIPADDSKPKVLQATSSCWQLFNWGKGCGWAKEETTDVGKGWAVEHEPYNVFYDLGGDITLHGNDCDGTVLKCKGSHTRFTLPQPDPNTPGQVIWYSGTKCNLNGDLDAGPTVWGDQLLSLLEQEGNTYGWDGNMDSVDQLFVLNPSSAICEYHDECDGYWKCFDDDADITLYFAGDAPLATTLTRTPDAVPIDQPAC